MDKRLYHKSETINDFSQLIDAVLEYRNSNNIPFLSLMTGNNIGVNSTNFSVYRFKSNPDYGVQGIVWSDRYLPYTQNHTHRVQGFNDRTYEIASVWPTRTETVMERNASRLLSQGTRAASQYKDYERAIYTDPGNDSTDNEGLSVANMQGGRIIYRPSTVAVQQILSRDRFVFQQKTFYEDRASDLDYYNSFKNAFNMLENDPYDGILALKLCENEEEARFTETYSEHGLQRNNGLLANYTITADRPGLFAHRHRPEENNGLTSKSVTPGNLYGHGGMGNTRRTSSNLVNGELQTRELPNRWIFPQKELGFVKPVQIKLGKVENIPAINRIYDRIFASIEIIDPTTGETRELKEDDLEDDYTTLGYNKIMQTWTPDTNHDPIMFVYAAKWLLKQVRTFCYEPGIISAMIDERVAEQFNQNTRYTFLHLNGLDRTGGMDTHDGNEYIFQHGLRLHEHSIDVVVYRDRKSPRGITPNGWNRRDRTDSFYNGELIYESNGNQVPNPNISTLRLGLPEGENIQPTEYDSQGRTTMRLNTIDQVGRITIQRTPIQGLFVYKGEGEDGD